MSVVSCARHSSQQRGLNYFLAGDVIMCTEIDKDQYVAKVRGSLEEPYEVYLNNQHPRKSKCNCPHAQSGKRIICKHIVATYYHVYPEEAQKLVDLYREIEAERRSAEKIYEQEYNEHLEKVTKRIHQLSVDELRQQLINYEMAEFRELYLNDYDEDDYDELLYYDFEEEWE